MKNILFPKIVDNQYKGHKIVVLLLGLYILKSFVAGFIHMFASDGGAQSIASVTLDIFTQGGSNSVITMFGLWGMEQVVIGLIVLVIVWRYKSLTSFAWSIYALEYLGRFLARFYTPGLSTDHTPPGAIIDIVLVPVAIFMFIFSIYSVKKSAGQKNLV